MIMLEERIGRNPPRYPRSPELQRTTEIQPDPLLAQKMEFDSTGNLAPIDDRLAARSD